MAADIRIGTIGWSNEDWRGSFYSPNVAATRMLDEYSRVFSTVEIDATFYGTPRPTSMANWAALVPDDFAFAAKVPSTITHDRRLIGASEAALDFANAIQAQLGPKLHALLLQLPPGFGPESYPTLRRFFAEVTERGYAGRFPWTVELRNAGWLQTDVADFLSDRGIVCATTDHLDLGTPLRYVRLLGTEHAFARFDERQADRTPELSVWADRLLAASAEADDGETIFAYTRDYYEGHSPGTLAVLGTLLGQIVPTPSVKQQMSLF